MAFDESVLDSSERDIDETGAWLSIGDLMSGLLMLFALLLVVSLLQLKEQEEAKERSRIVIIQSLKKALDAKGINAEVNEKTGDISIMDSVLFDTDSAILNAKGIKFLMDFIPLYSHVLLNDQDIREQITFLVIEGHTSSSGSWGYNMNLSMERAGAVYNIVDRMDFKNKASMLKKLMVAGRGKASARIGEESSEDRKVVFRIQFRGDEFYESFMLNRPRTQ